MDGDGAAPTVTRMIAAQAAARPHAPAVIFDRETMTFAELERQSRRAAGGLAALGVGPGDRVALWLPNVPEWLVLYLACARLGAIAVLVNTRFRSVEVGDIVRRSGARIIALWPGFRGIDFPSILAGVEPEALAGLEHVVACRGGPIGVEAGPPALTYEALCAGPPHDGDAAAPGDGSVIFTTSGTTSAPKFVLHSQFSVAEHARLVAADFGYDAADSVMLQALPLCGAFGFTQAMAMLAAGRPMVMMSAFDAAAAAEHVRAGAVTHMNGTDDMYRAMLAAREEARPFPTLRLAGFAAFNMEPDALDREARRRGLPLVGLYGMSEVQALFARQRVDAPDAERIRAGGYPVAPDAAVRVRDPQSGDLLPAGRDGELEIRGPSRMSGYFGDPEATRAALTDDGFVRSGDLGRLTGDGGFVFVARMGDALRLGGFLVSPAEIEARLQRHPAVAMTQVVGVPAGGATRAVAFVTLAPGADFDEAALRRHCADGLARFKVPARIAALDAFPTVDSPNGRKVQRARLREWAAGLVE